MGWLGSEALLVIIQLMHTLDEDYIRKKKRVSNIWNKVLASGSLSNKNTYIYVEFVALIKGDIKSIWCNACKQLRMHL